MNNLVFYIPKYNEIVEWDERWRIFYSDRYQATLAFIRNNKLDIILLGEL